MDERYKAYMGIPSRRIPHMEHWSCPDAETYLTGIDYYDHPKLCRERLAELYPELELPIPADDTPVPRPGSAVDTNPSDEPRHRVRWGAGESWIWDWGIRFESIDEALAFSPLEHGDFTNTPVVESRDYSDEEKLYQGYRAHYPDEKAPEGSSAAVGFYNTMFMWPLLTFGWDLFLQMCLDERFDRVMEEFAEINRRVFRSFARLPVNFVICHDDIVTARGPVCSPAWMHKHIFPRYEEFWGIVKATGKEVIFMADGCMDAYADDVLACGARGIITEPYTDFRAIVRKHENCFVAGEGDNRILMSNDPAAIRKMVEQMVETARMTGGYAMCIGNHIPWNVPGEAIKTYIELSRELGVRAR